MADRYRELREYVRTQMSKRGMNDREFGRLVGVNHTTIYRFRDDRLGIVPSTEFMIKLAEATGTTFAELAALVETENGQSTRARNQLLALQLSQLTEEQRLVVLNLIRGFLVSEQFGNRT